MDYTVYNDPLNTGTSFAGSVTNNQFYRVVLSQKGTGLTVVGNAPQDFEFTLQNEYTSLLTLAGQYLGDVPAVGGFAASALKGIIGGATIFGEGEPIAASIQVWTGTNPLEFTLPISFRAFSNPSKDVITPLRSLVQMGSPKRVGGAFMQAPGPTLKDAGFATATSLMGMETTSAFAGNFLTGLNKAITMQIGTGIIVPGLVITGLNVKVANRAERNSGLPTFAEATVSLRTFIAFSQDEVLAMFYGKGFNNSRIIVPANGSAAGGIAGGGS